MNLRSLLQATQPPCTPQQCLVSDYTIRTSCTTNTQQIESQQKVHNRSPQQVVEQTASLTTSRTTCCTTNPQLVEVMESDI